MKAANIHFTPGELQAVDAAAPEGAAAGLRYRKATMASVQTT